jgi:hypothetical protein
MVTTTTPAYAVRADLGFVSEETDMRIDSLRRTSSLLGGSFAVGCALIVGELPEARDQTPDGSPGGPSGARDSGNGSIPSQGGVAGMQPDGAGGARADASSAGGTASVNGTGNRDSGSGAKIGSGGASGNGAVSGSAGQEGASGSGGSGGSGRPDSGCAPGCDCDHDGAAGPECGGNDCDDRDANVSPAQTRYFATPSRNPAVGFDYNCSGAPERKDDILVRCLGITLGLCDAMTVGFLEDVPACGLSGSWGRCKRDLLSCSLDVIETRTMLCR